MMTRSPGFPTSARIAPWAEKVYFPYHNGSGGRIAFEFDEREPADKAKHGIDFVEAQTLWLDEALIEIPAGTTDESRVLVVGLIAGKHWSAVITYRSEAIRLISVRRARAEEVALYEG